MKEHRRTVRACADDEPIRADGDLGTPVRADNRDGTITPHLETPSLGASEDRHPRTLPDWIEKSERGVEPNAGADVRVERADARSRPSRGICKRQVARSDRTIDKQRLPRCETAVCPGQRPQRAGAATLIGTAASRFDPVDERPDLGGAPARQSPPVNVLPRGPHRRAFVVRGATAHHSGTLFVGHVTACQLRFKAPVMAGAASPCVHDVAWPPARIRTVVGPRFDERDAVA